MAVFRLPLGANKNIGSWRLMGSGGKGGFSIVPNFRQWAVLVVWKKGREEDLLQDPGIENRQPMDGDRGILFKKWYSFFKCHTTTYILQPIEGHGLWGGKEIFGHLPRQTGFEGKTAVLTRASIRLRSIRSFWKHLDGVALQMASAPGFLKAYGIGEIPLIRQATFSIWQNKAAMLEFAYGTQPHKSVLRKTRQENWYSEEMFVRFMVLDVVESP